MNRMDSQLASSWRICATQVRGHICSRESRKGRPSSGKMVEAGCYIARRGHHEFFTFCTSFCLSLFLWYWASHAPYTWDDAKCSPLACWFWYATYPYIWYSRRCWKSWSHKTSTWNHSRSSPGFYSPQVWCSIGWHRSGHWLSSDVASERFQPYHLCYHMISYAPRHAW